MRCASCIKRLNMRTGRGYVSGSSYPLSFFFSLFFWLNPLYLKICERHMYSPVLTTKSYTDY